MAIFLLWGFVLWGLVHPRYMSNQVNEWKSWISYNFTWFYIGAFVSQPPLHFKPNSRLITLCPNPEIATGVRTSLGECDASRQRVDTRPARHFRLARIVRPDHPRRIVSRGRQTRQHRFKRSPRPLPLFFSFLFVAPPYRRPD